MGYTCVGECVQDLERHGHLVRIDEEVDPDLEAALVVRRLYAARGPAVLFTRLKGCRFPAAGNLFGTMERARFLFRDTLETVKRMVELKVDPTRFLANPLRYAKVPLAALHTLPMGTGQAPALQHRTTLQDLPHVRTWPLDGGAFVTLPQVYTEEPGRPGWRHSNLGMYRVQMDGGRYEPGREVGLHYQIHRGIGVHHSKAIQRQERLRVSVSVGGPPALAVAAVMPLPEGLPELLFAGALAGRRIRLAYGTPADADFTLLGWIDPDRMLPEGPFGDHLGYYSLAHDFPVMVVESVHHRPGAVWPFTTVGRPPQEDTTFGELVHELTGPVIPTVLPGVHAVHAVDAAGVHPLLLAIGSERYTPYEERRVPRELLTQGNALLGQGQLSLAKYLLIVAREDDPELDIHDVPAFLRHLLERVDLRRDLHFQTRTTIDTLDYTGGALHEGSKVVIAAVGPPRRRLTTELEGLHLPEGFRDPRVCLPGILAVSGPPFTPDDPRMNDLRTPDGIPLVVVCEDSRFVARAPANLLWTAFTRSNPAADLHGHGAFVHQKHWGCSGPLVIDARPKPHHAPALEDDPAVVRRVEALAAPGRPLHGLI